MSVLSDADELRRRGLDVALDESRNLLIAKDPAREGRGAPRTAAPP